MRSTTLPFGDACVQLRLPESAEVLWAQPVPFLLDPAEEIRRSVNKPLGTPPLAELSRGRRSAAVVVSDNTRPVPYRGPQGILLPILDALEGAGVGEIKVIVACGTHRPMEEKELREMLGAGVFRAGVRVINNEATDASQFRSLGRTDRVPNVTVNRHYLDADLKIITGLVEPHFMAGFSGGRKAICPGICGQEVTYGLHSASILNHENATSLLVEGNPCHEEALRIAKMAGVDFSVNVTIDRDRRLTGVFAGGLDAAHVAAMEFLESYASIPLRRLYDVVILPAGDVGVNHYQCGKAAVEAAHAAKRGGHVVIVADLTDPDPVGGTNYREMLRLYVRLGPEEFCRTVARDDWTFVPEQWQVQMWAKAATRVGGTGRFLLCMPRLEDCPPDLIPEQNVAAQSRRRPGETDVDHAQRLVQETADSLIAQGSDAEVLVLPDGPYAVPVFEP